MAEHMQLLTTLKSVIKQKKLTYRMIAMELGVSESSIKRMLNSNDISMSKMYRLLELVDMDFGSLVQLNEQLYRTVSAVDIAVEQELIEDHLLLLIFFHLLNGWSVSNLVHSLEADELTIRRYVYRLSKLGIIEVLIGDRVRLLLAPNFKWSTNGPMETFVRKQVLPEYLSCNFSDPGELQLMSNGWLSESSLKELHRHAQSLVKKHQTLINKDSNLALHDRNVSTLLIAIRPWSLSIFDKYFKVDTKPNMNPEYWSDT